jgi:hypothetical protein
MTTLSPSPETFKLKSSHEGSNFHAVPEMYAQHHLRSTDERLQRNNSGTKPGAKGAAYVRVLGGIADENKEITPDSGYTEPMIKVERGKTPQARVCAHEKLVAVGRSMLHTAEA